MQTWDMIVELKSLVDEGEIYDDECKHETPSETSEFCQVCFIENLYKHASPESLEDELSEKQIETVHFLYMKYCEGEEISWDDFQDLK